MVLGLLLLLLAPWTPVSLAAASTASPAYRALGPDSAINALAIAPDGKIVVAGYSARGALTLARYAPDGALDPSFADRGLLASGFPHEPVALALRPDGGILVFSGPRVPCRGPYGCLESLPILAFDHSGHPDLAFGNGDGISATPVRS